MGAPGLRPSLVVQSNALFTNYPPSRQSQSYNSSQISQRVLPGKKKKVRHYKEWHLTDSVPGPSPCVPVAAAVVEWQGLAGAVCPQSSGPAAPTGDERTCWHSRFLYRQEVGVAPEQMSCIIGCFS